MADFIINLFMTLGVIVFLIMLIVHYSIKAVLKIIGDGITVIIKAIRPGENEPSDKKLPKN